MRKWMCRLLLTSCCIFSFAAVAAEEDRALTLADLMGGKQQYNLLNHQVLNKMIRQQPELARYQSVVMAWSDECLTWERMRVELARTYRSHFSEREMHDMLLFFRTASGQKYLRYAPLLKDETVLIGQRMAHEYQPRLLEMLQQAKQKSQSSH